MPRARTFPPRIVLLALLAGWMVPATAGAQSPPARPPARPPAPTLKPPSSAIAPPDADGFLRRWLVLEPIRTTPQLTDSAVRAAVAAHDIRADAGSLPRDGDTVKADDTPLVWHAVDTINYNVNLFHFAYALNKPTSNVLFWVATVVHAPRDLSDVRLAIGSNAASVWWVNGEEVIALYNDRQAVVDDGVSNRLTLKRGANVIRAAIINGGGATDFCARLLDAQDRPIRDVTVGLTTTAGK
jgi:hypothetical protein